jgi:putative Mg2+ transporter-C (MgtC) family protein
MPWGKKNDMQVSIDDIFKISLALGLGAVLGIEREYRSKAAGFRTLTMISIGACLFTIISRHLGLPGSPDRIASNIVQGIGFLGAGVIFKDNVSVSGLTTATSIWVASAIGMSVGAGAYILGCFTTVSALIVLAGFELIQRYIDNWSQHRLYKVTFLQDNLTSQVLEDGFNRNRLRFHKKKESRDQAQVSCWYELYGKATCFETLDRNLLEDSRILAFDN